MKGFLCVLMVFVSLGACSSSHSSGSKTGNAESKNSEQSTKSLDGRPAVSPDNSQNAAKDWKLTGEWRVKRAETEMFVFNFYGAEASVRYPTKDNEEISGKIALFSTNGFAITPNDGRRHIFRYVVEDDQVFIGRGESHFIEDSAKFSFKVTSKHAVHFDGNTCTLKNGDKFLQTIECTYDREAEPPVLTYDSPIPAMPGPKRSRKLYLVGKTLISETLYGYKASKVE